MNMPVVQTKDELIAGVQSWVSRASTLEIVDRESCLHASQLLKSIKTLRAGVAGFWAPHIEAAMETKRKAETSRKALVDERDAMDLPLADSEARVKRELLAFEAQQERTRAEQERQLQAAAQREAERVTLEAAAALERDAVAAGDEAMLAEAQDILAQPIEAPVVSVASSMPKVAGIAYRDNWKAHDDVDVRALARAVWDGTAAPTLLIPNMSALHKIAKATEGTQAVPGVKFWNDRQIAARG